MNRYHRLAVGLLAFGALPATIPLAFAAEGKRQIEEVVVTAEKREATVSDTSISITAFSADNIEEFGLQSADELVNYIPATTRDSYDIRIRGVGRNFRALGGDPGVSTYYNGVYSPDFGIAASENALYDLERVEVLRGPQGTLYGRNAIGGALNYVTKSPTYEWTGNARMQLGEFATREFYGVISGPIIEDTLAFRVVGVKRDRDGDGNNVSGGDDLNSTDDRNLTLSLHWQITDNIDFLIRGNDRESDRVIGSFSVLNEGPTPARGIHSTNIPVHGLRAVNAGDPGALAFTDPVSGGTVYGAYNRPGVDRIGWPYQPNPHYGSTNAAAIMAAQSKSDPKRNYSVNQNGNNCSFPYTDTNCNHEFFGHRSGQAELNWEVSEDLSIRYVLGNTDFDYTYNLDNDGSDSEHSMYRATVLESVYNYSHEIQIFWNVGEKWSATTGIYMFNEMRWQDYSLSNTTPRYTMAADYGALNTPVGFLGGASVMDLFYAGGGSDGGHKTRWTAAEGYSDYGSWGGDPRGDVYHHQNRVHNQANALYTQGTYEINDEFQLVLGLRFAEDKKAAREVRGGYSEETIAWTAAWLEWIDPASPGFGLTPGAATGMTELGLVNIHMGNATYSGDPANPLVPVCAIDDATCTRPLRLGGVPISFGSHVAGSDQWDDVNYRINLDWTPNDDILMYFSYTTGYRSGGFQLGVTDARDQPRDPVTGLPVPSSFIEPLKYDMETVASIEIGYKGMHFDNTLQINASIYNYDYKGYQDRLNVFDPIRAQSVDIVQNADKARNTGFEIDFLWLASDEITIGGNYSYTDTAYDTDYWVALLDDPSIPGFIRGPLADKVQTCDAEGVAAGTCTATADEIATFLAISTENAKGSQLKRIPKHKAVAWASYVMPTDVGNVSFRGSWSYTGEYFGAGVEREIDKVPSRSRIDVSASWTDLDDKWTVRAFIDNVTDEVMLRGIGSGGESVNWRETATVLYPRYWGVDVTYRFGN